MADPAVKKCGKVCQRLIATAQACPHCARSRRTEEALLDTIDRREIEINRLEAENALLREKCESLLISV
jgi:RNA polymerase subunit RPABC4/transcription elongation factor Spt4